MGEIGSLVAAASKAVKVGGLIAVMAASNAGSTAPTVGMGVRIVQDVISTVSNVESATDVLHQLDPSLPEPGDPPWGGGPTGSDFSTELDLEGERERQLREEGERVMETFRQYSVSASAGDGHLLELQSSVSKWQTVLADSSFSTGATPGSSVTVTTIENAAEEEEAVEEEEVEDEEVEDEEVDDDDDADEDDDAGEDPDDDPG